MTPDFWFGLALGLPGGIGIGSLILAAYHDYTMQGIVRAEQEWDLDHETLKAAMTQQPPKDQPLLKGPTE